MSQPRTRSRDAGEDPSAQLAELVGRMAQQDEAALGRFYDLMSPRAFGLILQVCRDRDVAEEVTLDVFHEAWRRAPEYQPGRGQPHTWLLAIARSRAIDRLRSMKRRQPDEAPLRVEELRLADPGPDPSADLALREEGERVRAALAEINPDQARLLKLSFFHGLSHADIARHVDLPLGTVKSRIRLGLQHLARILPSPGDREA